MQQSEIKPAAASQRKGSGAYFAASILSQFSALVRYTTLARLLGPEQIGLASILIITASFFDLVTSTEGERFIIQDRDGDNVRMQSLVQLVLSARGLLVAVVMVALAWPIATFYKRPELGPALAILALQPLAAGFIHLDMHRAQRVNDFRQEAYAVLIAEVVSLAATLVAAFLIRNFTAVLYGLIMRSVVFVLVSHIQASRPYKLAIAGEFARRLAAFGVPLMLNGALLFFGGQGDRIMVGRTLGVAPLGHYSAVLLLIAYPASAIQRYVMAMYLPNIAAEQDESVDNQKARDQLGGQTLLLSLAMSAGFALVAPPMVVILYGRGFAQTALLIAMIGVLQTTRFMIIWPTTVSLGLGKSANILASNIVRLLAMPAGAVGGYLVHGLEGVVMGFAIGEFAAVAAAAILLNVSNGVFFLKQMDRLGLFALGSAAIVAWVFEIERGDLFEGLVLAGLTIGLVGWIAKREAAAIQASLRIAQSMLQTAIPLRLGFLK